MARKTLIAVVVLGATVLMSAGYARAQDEGDWDDGPGHEALGESSSPPELRTLNGYGQWVTVPAYGRAWRPYVDDDWRPYWRGYWSWNGQWVWVSGDPWGDAPF